MLFFYHVFAFLTDVFTFCVPRTANSPSKSSKLQTLTYIYIDYTRSLCYYWGPQPPRYNSEPKNTGISLSIRQTTSKKQRLDIFLSSKTSDQHSNQPTLLFNWYRKLLRRRLSGRDVRLTTHLHPVHGVYRVNCNFYNTTAIQTINATPPSDALKALRPKLVSYGVGQPRRRQPMRSRMASIWRKRTQAQTGFFPTKAIYQFY